LQPGRDRAVDRPADVLGPGVAPLLARLDRVEVDLVRPRAPEPVAEPHRRAGQDDVEVGQPVDVARQRLAGREPLLPDPGAVVLEQYARADLLADRHPSTSRRAAETDRPILPARGSSVEWSA